MGAIGTDTRVPRWLRLSVQFVRTATTVAALMSLVTFTVLDVVSAPRPASPSQHSGASIGPLEATMTANRCSFTGFDADVIPSSALVRTPAGDTEMVSFDRGWAVFSGEAEGELVAVCLGPAAPTGTAVPNLPAAAITQP